MRISTLFLAFPLMFVVACDTGDLDTDTDEPAAIEIAGDWVDNFGGSHVIDSELWTSSDAEFDIVEYDNTAAFALAQNDAANEYNPSLYSRYDWSTNDDGDFVFCQSVYDGADLDAARAGSSDADDLAAGCGGFSWSVLTPAP